MRPEMERALASGSKTSQGSVMEADQRIWLGKFGHFMVQNRPLRGKSRQKPASTKPVSGNLRRRQWLPQSFAPAYLIRVWVMTEGHGLSTSNSQAPVPAGERGACRRANRTDEQHRSEMEKALASD